MRFKRSRSVASGSSARNARRPFTATAKLIGVAAAGVIVAGCARIPLPDRAATGPQIDELVWRVKCDLHDAFADRINAPYGQEWLHSWTAQANLNLIVNDQSQLSPGAAITQPLGIVTIPQKVTNFAQSFNMGLGAQWSDTATRNETISFSVSLEDLVKEIDEGPHDCRFPQYADLRSELGLKQWIEQSLSPADHNYLTIGAHKAPKTGGTGPATAKATQTLQALSSLTSTNARGLGKECKRPAVDHQGPPDTAVIQLDLDVIGCDLKLVLDQKKFDLKNLTGTQVQFIAKTITDIQIAIRDMMSMGEVWDKPRKALENAAIELSVFVDPPIDTLAHQVQFIIMVSGSASPSWTLVNFKGPAPAAGSLASLTKTKTHTLIVTIGPPSSQDAQGAMQALLTGTALTNSLNTGAVVVTR